MTITARSLPLGPAIIRLFLVVLLGLTAVRSGRGAAPPQVFQNQATEILEIRVERIVRLEQPGWVLFRARVLAVRRSAAGTRVGDSILVRYPWDPADIERREAKYWRGLPPPGPQFLYEPDPPASGATLFAHLVAERTSGDDARRDFLPGAYQYTFEPLP